MVVVLVVVVLTVLMIVALCSVEGEDAGGGKSKSCW